MATAFENEENDIVQVPPILALPYLGLENELEKIDHMEIIFHSVLTGANAQTVFRQSSCLWYFVLQTANETVKKKVKKEIINGNQKVGVILATAILNADDGMCAIFRGSDQQPLPTYFQFQLPVTFGNEKKKNGKNKIDQICQWRNIYGDLSAMINRNAKTISTLDGIRDQKFGQLNVAKSSGSSKGIGHSIHNFECEQLQVANVTHYSYKDRSNSIAPFLEVNEAVDKILFRLDFLKDSKANTKSACLGVALALACQDTMTYFNPNKSPKLASNRKQPRSTVSKPTTTL